MDNDRDLVGSANKSADRAISNEVLQIKRSDMDQMLDAALARRVGADRHDHQVATTDDPGRTDHPARQESADRNPSAGIDHGPGEISETRTNRVTSDNATSDLTDSATTNPPEITDRATKPAITSSPRALSRVRSACGVMMTRRSPAPSWPP